MADYIQPDCSECGGNCGAECGQHPAGCLFSGQMYGEWQIHPKCRLPHYNVARGRAKLMLESMDSGVRVWRSHFAR